MTTRVAALLLLAPSFTVKLRVRLAVLGVSELLVYVAARKAAWEKVVAGNGGIHPNCGIADTRLLHRARHTAVPATRGGGLHPNREVWVRELRTAERSGFVPHNRHRPDTKKAF